MSNYDLVVIGAGPGGYVAAIRAAQLGLKTAIVEKEYWGGVCLNVGCIPSKCLLEDTHLYHEVARHGKQRGILFDGLSYDWGAMQERKNVIVKQLTGGVEFLLKKNKVEMHFGSASLKDAKSIVVRDVGGNKSVLTASNCIIATGSVSADLPHIKPDGSRVLTSTEALSLEKVPESLAVIGAGAIGLEMGSVYARLGSKVTVVEIMAQVLPGSDKEIADNLARELRKEGVTIHLESKVASLSASGNGEVLSIEGKFNGEVVAEKVLLSVGRKPNTHGLGLESARVEVCGRGFIKVDDSFRTNVPGVYAIGDVIGGMLLAHKASHEGIAAAEIIAGGVTLQKHAIPSIVYTVPEMASVGLTSAQALEQGKNAKEGKFLFRANGRALAMNSIAGFVKVVADCDNGDLLGVHILGPAAGELIHDAAVALASHMKLSGYQAVLRGHPTLSEAIGEAALSADKRAIHKIE